MEHAWGHPFATSSDFARKHSRQVALAASLGWITNITPRGDHYSTRWHISETGYIALKHYEKETAE